MTGFLHFNNITDHTIQIDRGDKLFVRRQFSEGLLDIENLRTGTPYKIEAGDGTLRLPDVSWLEDMLRTGRLSIVADCHGPIASKKVVANLESVSNLMRNEPSGG